MKGGSVSVVSPIVDTLLTTVCSGIIVVVVWVMIGGGKVTVEIGVEKTGGDSGKEVVGGDVVTTETVTFSFGDGGGVGIL